MQNWLVVDEKYLNDIREKEKRIPNSDYGEDKYKPFFGVLFEKDDLVYITQVSHPKERHHRMKNSLDFKKVYDKSLIAVVNLNYMFPVPKSLVKNLKYKNIDDYRTFICSEQRSKYIDLLKTELKSINKLNLEVAAKKVYNLKKQKPDDTISKRCFDFIDLENFASKYLK